jgi:hypothetical protein
MREGISVSFVLFSKTITSVDDEYLRYIPGLSRRQEDEENGDVREQGCGLYFSTSVLGIRAIVQRP